MNIWQIIIIVTVLLETIYNLVAKIISDKADKDKPLITFIGRYVILVIAGFILGGFMLNWQIPAPNFSGYVWLLFIIEGLMIPIGAMSVYIITQKIGAGGSVLVCTLFTMVTAAVGAAVLRESISSTFLLGGLLIISGVAMVALSEHKLAKSRLVKRLPRKKTNSIFLNKVVYGRNGLWYAILIGCLFFPIGYVAEKLTLDQVGLWVYCIYGWPFQMIGTALLLIMFGRYELQNKRHVIRTFNLGLILGVFLALESVPYLYAISIGEFSGTSVALTGPIALTFFCSAIVFKEYQHITTRTLSCIMAVVGIILIVS